jgi:hypothetical protein
MFTETRSVGFVGLVLRRCNLMAIQWQFPALQCYAVLWPIFGPFVARALFGPFWVHYGSTLGLFVFLGPFWILFWAHLGPILGPNFGFIPGLILGPYLMFLKPTTKQTN